MSYTITVDLGDMGVSMLLRNLEKYRMKLEQNISTYLDRLAERLCELAQEGFSGAFVDVARDGSIPAGAAVTWSSAGSDTRNVMAAGGEVLFIEFGAGVSHNTAVGGSTHPKGQELGLTIGSYGPRGAQRAWLYSENGEIRWTEGTPAQMPMYNAVLKLLDEAPGIAMEVFG